MDHLPCTKQSIALNEANKRVDKLYQKIAGHIDGAKLRVLRSIDTEMVKAYWLSGRDIILEEQNGASKAGYGTEIIQLLSDRLTKSHGRGFSLSSLKDMRQFYLNYQQNNIKNGKSHAVRGFLAEPPSFSNKLSWTHYRELMRIKRPDTRLFYEKEAIQNHWSSRELKRQIASLLYDRLAASKDKDGLMNLAYQGQTFHTPEDAIKEPLVLEFLGLPEPHTLNESKLEEALINNLQHFLLELGKGFAFVARQKRLTFDGDHFYTDLVFYHIVLKCYVLIDLKTKKLNHGDLGQMLLYVNYFDQEIKQFNDNPTIGLILCTEKSDAMVRYTLGEKTQQIFASQYQFHLPTEHELEEMLKKQLDSLQEAKQEAEHA